MNITNLTAQEIAILKAAIIIVSPSGGGSCAYTLFRKIAEQHPGDVDIALLDWSGNIVYLGVEVGQAQHRIWTQRTGYPNLLAVRDDDISEALLHGSRAWRGQ